MRKRFCFSSALVVGLLAHSPAAQAQGAPPPPPPKGPPVASSAAPAIPPPPPPPPSESPPPSADASSGTTPVPPNTQAAPPPPPPGEVVQIPITQPPPPPPNGQQAPQPGAGARPPYYYIPPPGFSLEKPKQKKETNRWYGWQTLIGVGAGDILALLGQGSAVSYVGLMGHMLTGPIVHWAHGHVGKGFGSLGLNVGAPGIGFLIGLGVGGSDINGSITGALGGAFIGYLAGPAIDMAVLSTETVEVTDEKPKGARALLPTSIAIVPMLDKGRVGLSLVGQL